MPVVRRETDGRRGEPRRPARQLPPGRARSSAPRVRRDGGREGRRLRPRRRRRGARVPRRRARRRSASSSVAEGRRAAARRASTAPIVVLGGAFPGEERRRRAHDLAAAVWTLDGGARARRRRARGGPHGRRAPQGRHRHDAARRRRRRTCARFGEALRGVAGISTSRGVFSHFASADAVDTAAAQRAARALPRRRSTALAAAGVRPPHVHLANSAAVLSRAARRTSRMVRPGLDALRLRAGAAPRPRARAAARRCACATAVAQVRRVPAGHAGRLRRHLRRARAEHDRDAAGRLRRRLPSRSPRTAARCWCAAARVPIAGRVCMDHVMLDVTDVPRRGRRRRRSSCSARRAALDRRRRASPAGATRSPTRC